jgi:hypothetical protein
MSTGARQHHHNMTLAPREAIVYALSVRWPGETCSIGKLASISRQSRLATYECMQKLHAEIDQIERVPGEGGMPRYRWIPDATQKEAR